MSAARGQWTPAGPDCRWPAYEVYPASNWNYALVLGDEPEKCFEVIKRPGAIAEQPFTVASAPIELKAAAKKVPDWTEDELGMVGPIPASPVGSPEPVETVTLIPMGCGRLRISAFPMAAAGADKRR